MASLDPAGIMEIASGYWDAKVLLSAVGLGLLTELAKAPLTRRQVEQGSGCSRGPAADFDGLVSMALLVRAPAMARLRAT